MIEKFKKLSPRLRKWLKLFFIACAALTLLDLVVQKHGDHWWNLFGFHALYGFVACVILVLIATWMRKPLMRAEDYYDEDYADNTADNTAENQADNTAIKNPAKKIRHQNEPKNEPQK